MFYFHVRTRFQRSLFGRLFDVVVAAASVIVQQIGHSSLVATSSKLDAVHSRRGSYSVRLCLFIVHFLWQFYEVISAFWTSAIRLSRIAKWIDC